MRGSFRFLALITIVGLSPGWMLGQDRTAELRTRFRQETDAMRRVQMMAKLGEREFDEIARDIDAGELVDGLAVLNGYRDEIWLCEEGMDAKNIDAEKHPKGYKQLEISLRQSLRRLNNLLAGLTTDEQAPFVKVRNDLNELNQHLVHELFPN